MHVTPYPPPHPHPITHFVLLTMTSAAPDAYPAMKCRVLGQSCDSAGGTAGEGTTLILAATSRGGRVEKPTPPPTVREGSVAIDAMCGVMRACADSVCPADCVPRSAWGQQQKQFASQTQRRVKARTET